LLGESEDGLCRKDCDGSKKELCQPSSIKTVAPPTSSTTRPSTGTKPAKPKYFELIDVDAATAKQAKAIDEPDFPLPHNNKTNLRDLINSQEYEYMFKVGDFVVYGESKVEEYHRLGMVYEVHDSDDDDDDRRLLVRFQKVGSPRFEFDVQPISVHLELAVPMDEYRIHDGKRFLYYGPPPRRWHAHGLYIGTRCTIVPCKDPQSGLNPGHFTQLYVGDIFLLNTQIHNILVPDVWCMVLGFLRHESSSHEWTVLLYGDVSFLKVQDQNLTDISWEKQLFGISTAQLVKMLPDQTTYTSNRTTFNALSPCFTKVSHFLLAVDTMLKRNPKSTIMTMTRYFQTLSSQPSSTARPLRRAAVPETSHATSSFEAVQVDSKVKVCILCI
jgi:hypothetical protein